MVLCCLVGVEVEGVEGFLFEFVEVRWWKLVCQGMMRQSFGV